MSHVLRSSTRRNSSQHNPPKRWLTHQFSRAFWLQQAEISYNKIENYWRRTEQQKLIRQYESFWPKQTAVFQERIAADPEALTSALATFEAQLIYPGLRQAESLEKLVADYVAQHPKRGRKSKTLTYLDANQLLAEQPELSWPEIAKEVTPEAYAADPRKAGEALRLGVRRLKP